MPNWKKVIVSGSNAVLNNITASGAISASGELYAGLSAWSGLPSNNQVVTWNSATGELMYTGSYSSGGGGILTVTEQDGTPSVTTDTYNIFKFESGQLTLDGGNTIQINAPTLDQVTDQGNTTSNSALFLTSPDLVWGNPGTATKNADSGFLSNGTTAKTHVTPQHEDVNFFMVGVRSANLNGQELSEYPNNYLVYHKVSYLGAGGDLPDGGGGGGGTNPGGGGTNDDDHPNDGGGHLQVTGKSINLIASSSTESSETNNYRGVGIYPSALYFFNKEASGSISGALQPTSASAKIKFDTGSNAVKFFAGSTDEELKEVLHISKSGDNPRIGVGISNPLRAFDFKEVRDDNRGGEILVRGSRTTKGAEVGDEAGRINFVIDSGSYGDVETSGSTAEIVALVDDVDKAGVKGSLSFRVATTKEADSVERFKITPDRIQATGSFVISGSNSFTNIGPAIFSGSITGTETLDITGTTTLNALEANGSLINRLRIGAGSAPTSAGVLSVQDYSTLYGGLTIGGGTDPGFGNLIISGSEIHLPSLTTGNATTNYDKLLIVDSVGQTRTLAKNAVPYIEVFDGATPTNQTLVMFSGSTGDVANATGVSYNAATGWNFSGVGSAYDITVDDIIILNDLTAVGDISAANGSFSGDLTVQGNIIAEQYIVSSSVTHLTQSFSSGSTIFGDTLDDTHQFTGSIDVTGSLTLNQGGLKVFLDSGSAFEVDEPDIDLGGRFKFSYSQGDPTLSVISRSSTSTLKLVANNESGDGLTLTEDGLIQKNNVGGVVVNQTDFSPNSNNYTALGRSNRQWTDIYATGIWYGDSANNLFSIGGTQRADGKYNGGLVYFGFADDGTGAPFTSSLRNPDLHFLGVGSNNGAQNSLHNEAPVYFKIGKSGSLSINLDQGDTGMGGDNFKFYTASAMVHVEAEPSWNMDLFRGDKTVDDIRFRVDREGNTTISGSLTASGLNYPNTDGNDGQVLLTDGSGKLTFGDVKVYAQVKNISGVTLAKGTPVHATASASPPSGNVSEVIAASASLASTMPATFILDEELANEAEGRAILSGFINGVDTSAFKEGDVVYVGENGGYTTTKPTGTNLIQNLGIIIKVDASNGAGYIYGSGRSNDVPNITEGYAWVGNSSGVATATATSSFVVTTSNTASYVAAANIDGTIDISDQTNLAGGTNLTLSGDTMNLDANISLTSVTASGDITSNTFETISTTLASDSATNVDTFASSSYNGAIYDYILKDTGVGARAGQFMVAHDNGLITFTDNSTKHLSDATAPEISAQINGANIEVQVTNGNGYTFKSFVKKL